MPNVFIYPYGPSQSAELLRAGLGGLLIRRVGSRYRPKREHTIINWGSASRPACLVGATVINSPEAVVRATSKMGTYKALKDAGVPTLEWTRDVMEATKWNEQVKIVGRDLDHGSGGRGITIYPIDTPPKQHLFYTKYFKKEREFRIHVFNGKVIFQQEKLRKKGVEFDKYIRSHDRGWCFAFSHLADLPVPEEVRNAATNAVTALGLDFGGVDLGWNRRDGACCIEVNTAPGIEESSLNAYVKAFKETKWEF